ncbi:EamA family transporter [Marinomonas mediterranea]|uniref:EamA family transporter n=1 Tax=Marinomonas mediterranea TaxID=119864 RepID=UPI00234B896F|nr:EamA family transporter [Marinomonas mediterranea]WCN07737.1 EamA family transporter [Marinomonas mediterranea]WCN11837.1 EamA family transporter [Marinomonas mediterranea]
MPLYARLLVIIIPLIWGFNFVVIRWGAEHMDPVMMTCLRFTFTALPLVFFLKRPNVPMSMIALHGLLFGIGMWGMVNVAVALGMPAGLSSILLQSAVFMTLIMAVLFFKERLPTVKSIGIFVAFIGFLLVVIFRGEAVPVAGIILIFVAAISWTGCNAIIRIYKPNRPISFIVWSSVFVPVPTLVLAAIQQYASFGMIDIHQLIPIPSLNGWLSIVFQSLITTIIGYGLWTWAIMRYGLGNVAPYSLLVPVSGLFFGWAIYEEALSSMEVIGSSTILAGLAILSYPVKASIK